MGYSHGKKWDEQEIINAIKKVVEQHDMDTMPTHSELDEHYGSTSVSNAISKHGGSRYFAKLLGLQIKTSETKFGEVLEDYCALEIQQRLGLICDKTNSRYPYDILVNRTVKVDVKAGRQFDNYGGAKYYTFNIEKKEQTCDVFVFYCMNSNDEIKKTLVIPSYVLSGKSQLAVGENSVYDKYDGKWDFIRKYDEFISSCV